jgi:hypothetical protein
MAGVLRSKHGCWTCRLRKKKCDEERPCCNTCKSLTITCHGYGPRPSWMSNPEEREAMKVEIGFAVKNPVKKKHTQKLASSTTMRPILPASDLLDNSTSSTDPPHAPPVHHIYASDHEHSDGLPGQDSSHEAQLLRQQCPRVYAHNVFFRPSLSAPISNVRPKPLTRRKRLATLACSPHETTLSHRNRSQRPPSSSS